MKFSQLVLWGLCPKYQSLTKILQNTEKEERQTQRDWMKGRREGKGKNYRPIYLMDIGAKYLQNISKSNPATYKMDNTL